MPWVAVAIGAAAGAIGSGVAGAEAANSQHAANLTAQEQIQGAMNQAHSRNMRGIKSGLAEQQGLMSLAGNQLNQGFGGAQGTLQSLMGQVPQGQNVANFMQNGPQADPGFDFQMEQGIRAIESSNSASGGRNSGAAMKELASFGQGLAATRSQEAFNRALAADQLSSQNFGQLASLGTNLAGTQMQQGSALAGLSQMQGQQALQGQQMLAGMRDAKFQNQAQAFQMPLQTAGGEAAAFASMFNQIQSSADAAIGAGIGAAGAAI